MIKFLNYKLEWKVTYDYLSIRNIKEAVYYLNL